MLTKCGFGEQLRNPGSTGRQRARFDPTGSDEGGGKQERRESVEEPHRELSLEQLPVPEGACRKGGEGLCTRVCSDRTRGNGCKLKEGRLRLDIRKKFFTMRVVKHWHRLPREAVDAPSLAVFKARLDGALSNLVW